jgi:hypothetical protein
VLFEMAKEFGTALHADVILFEAGTRTHLRLPGVTFRKRDQEDAIFRHPQNLWATMCSSGAVR